MVSALVTFDAWPTRDGGASADDIAIERAPSARAVRAVRVNTTAGGTTTSHRGRGASSTAIGSASFGGGTGGPGGNGPSNPGPPHVPAAPTPYVPPAPPGEGDPAPGRPVSPRTDRGPGSGPVTGIACGAGQTVAGLNGGAGAALGTACKTAPPSGASGDRATQPLVFVSRVLHDGN